MYKFKTLISMQYFSNKNQIYEAIMPQKKEIEWYMNMELDLDGIKKFIFHIPDQIIQIDKVSDIEVKKAKVVISDQPLNLTTTGLKPKKLLIDLDNNKAYLKF